MGKYFADIFQLSVSSAAFTYYFKLRNGDAVIFRKTVAVNQLVIKVTMKVLLGNVYENMLSRI